MHIAQYYYTDTHTRVHIVHTYSVYVQNVHVLAIAYMAFL